MSFAILQVAFQPLIREVCTPTSAAERLAAFEAGLQAVLAASRLSPSSQ
jgi:hypothetical protein